MSAWLVWRRGQAGLADWKHLGWAGWSAATVSSAATICFIAAFKNTAVANVAIIYATAPFAAAAIAWVWMRETPGLATLAAAGLCLAGVTVMVGGWQAFVQAQHQDVFALAARAEARLPQDRTIHPGPGPFLPRRPRRLITVEKTRYPRFLDNPCVNVSKT